MTDECWGFGGAGDHAHDNCPYQSYECPGSYKVNGRIVFTDFCKYLGEPVPDRPRMLSPKQERNDEIRRLSDSGCSYSEIARRFSLSITRVQQICSKERNYHANNHQLMLIDGVEKCPYCGASILRVKEEIARRKTDIDRDEYWRTKLSYLSLNAQTRVIKAARVIGIDSFEELQFLCAVGDSESFRDCYGRRYIGEKLRQSILEIKEG